MKIVKVTALSGALVLFRMLGNFVVAKAVAVYAGPSGLAMLGQVQNFVSCINGAISAPVGTGVVRFTAQQQKQGFAACAGSWSAALRLFLFSLALVIPLVAYGAPWLAQRLLGSSEYSNVILIATIALPFAGANTLVTSVVNGLQRYKQYAALGIFSTIITTVLTVVLVTTAGVKGALIAAALNTGVTGVIALLIVSHEPWFRSKLWFGKVRTDDLKNASGYLIMGLTSALVIPVSMIGLRHILVANLSWEQAGQWQAVWKISEVYLGVITTALSTYYLPRLSSLTAQDELVGEIRRTVLIVVPTVSLLALVVYLLRDVALMLLFTAQFREARDLFAVQLLGDVVKVVSWVFAMPMLARGAARLFVASEIFFGGLFVGLAALLVPQYGAQGANWAYLLSYVLYLAVFIVYSNRIRR